MLIIGSPLWPLLATLLATLGHPPWLPLVVDTGISSIITIIIINIIISSSIIVVITIIFSISVIDSSSSVVPMCVGRSNLW